ncbi:MAG TPA: ABC transporter ATP-binding protein [Candidatus Avacidaminococcus intestinavium]|uniref:ABC transporter ATP-binding protein n=1 Tax=Candidatus Avacidaminococcus intestinavium TaxID=2840684 RepID=A0A9D1MPB6_9FIRM|nr:ABC transporter ATP-binding protein [Candidatus Avacidaminococcus intestinavium]
MIEFKNVTMSFGDKTILEDLSFSVYKGETLAVIGPSGTGKSTVLRLIIGLLTPVQGKVLIKGQDVSTFKEDEWNQLRQDMGMVFQYSALFDFLTVGENVAFGLRQHTEKTNDEIKAIVAARLAEVGLPHLENSWPAELSGGMKKRVGLARATALQPEIMLYDEPTAGLDPIMSENINDLIKETKKRMRVTSILVTHDMNSVLAVADRVLLLYDKKIAAIGTLEEIKNNTHPILQKFLKTQTNLSNEERGKVEK